MADQRILMNHSPHYIDKESALIQCSIAELALVKQVHREPR